MLELVSNMFVPEISVLEKIIRPTLVYLFLIIGLRLAGKRELAQLNPFDLVVLLTLSNTVQKKIIGPDDSFIGGVIDATAQKKVIHANTASRYKSRLTKTVAGLNG